MTFIKIFNVPDLGGFPPSTPVRTNLIVACFSRSKALFSTNSNINPQLQYPLKTMMIIHKWPEDRKNG
uniref:Uncharacterized protein n=1 Tax=Cyprinus carpio TaxID=7962 RepID=A0A8C2BTE0_CYPCA